MKILVISTSFPNKLNKNSGIFVFNQFKKISELGCEVKVIYPVAKPLGPFYQRNKNFPDFEWIEGIEVIYADFRRIPSRLGHPFGTLRISKEICNLFAQKSFIPDIVHSNWLTPSGYAGMVLGRKMSIPTVCTVRGSDINLFQKYDPLSNLLTKRTIENTNSIVAVSRDLAEKTKNLVKKKIEVTTVYTGINPQKFSPDEELRNQIRKLQGIEKDDTVFIFIGKIIKEKGIWDLLRAFEEILYNNGNVRLIVIGKGKGRELREYITRKNLSENVYYKGAVPHEEIPRWLNASDVFVLPSSKEGVPNSMIEAMACKKAVIVSKVGGVPEILNNENGIMVRPGDISSLKKNMEKLCVYEIREKYAREGYETINKNFTWEKNANEYYRIYQELLK